MLLMCCPLPAFKTRIPVLSNSLSLKLTASDSSTVLRDKKKKKRKDLNDPDNHDGVITQLEPDILESARARHSGM